MKRLAGRTHGLEILAAVASQSKIELVPGDDLLDHVVVAIELVSDRPRG